MAFLDVNGNIKPSSFYIKNGPNAFPYDFKIEVTHKNWMNYVDGWSLYPDIRSEMTRQGVDLNNSEQFRLYHNQGFKLCMTYPEHLVVPKAINNSQVEGCAKFRTKSRLPALTYYHRETGTSIWRCSQCMQSYSRRSTDDEDMLMEIGRTSNNS